jgi:hypothetical protein
MAKKEAGAGRGFVNPQRTDESNADYITPAQRYEMEQQTKADREQADTTKAYNKTVGMKSGGTAKYMKFSDSGKPMGMAPVTKMAAGGTASSRADGIAARGKTRGKIC